MGAKKSDIGRFFLHFFVESRFGAVCAHLRINLNAGATVDTERRRSHVKQPLITKIINLANRVFWCARSSHVSSLGASRNEF